MPNLGTKKKSNLSRMDKYTEDLPKLTNEMQLSIMNKVKTGELSVDDALYLARKDWEFLQQSLEEGVQENQPPQYNFSVHKHGRYMWHKRVLQIDFKTKMLCSIEKGIVNRQLPFAMVKSCDDGVGSKFFISFKGHHDYELEATSLEDKHKIMQLVNQIIYGNIYSDTEEGDEETHQQPQATQSLREGVLLLHRGGLASFKWVKYEVQLHPGQLTLTPFRSRAPADGEMTPNAPLPIVIHLSDGDTSVQKPPCPDAFTLITHKNKYQFKMPASDQTGAVQKERDDWVAAIHRLCSDWKRKSMGDLLFVEGLQSLSIAEDAEDTNTDLESSGGFSGGSIIYPPADYVNTDISSTNGDTSQIYPPADYPKPVPAPRSCNRADDQDPSPPVLSPTSPTAAPISSPTPPSPSCTPTTSPSTVPESLKHESGSSAVKGPPPPLNIPVPPPLPIKPKKNLSKRRTKAFHWDTVSPAKIAKSFWKQESTRRIEIDTSRLYEQFAIQDVGMFGATEQSNVQHILLNQKIAHNFNIFLKSFPVQPGELKDKLFIIKEEDGGLSDEHITSLRRYVPTVDDVEMYTSHKGPVADLHIVDQYMMEMCNIPYLSTQLDLLLSVRELPISMNDLQPLINQKIRMCMRLYDCRSFVSVLEYLLAIGNYLNENAGKEKAKGFQLSSLTKLTQLRGRDKKFTLLHALVEQIMLHEPSLASFTQELAEFETVPGASIMGLTAEVDVLKNELQKIIQYGKTSKNRYAGTQPPNFSKELKAVIEKYNTDLSALTKTCEEMKKLYFAILVKFGEPADRDSQKLFELICQFILGFKKAHADII